MDWPNLIEKVGPLAAIVGFLLWERKTTIARVTEAVNKLTETLSRFIEHEHHTKGD